jgi:N-acetylglutamate synthase-like GNAT family acetyltransferase
MTFTLTDVLVNQIQSALDNQEKKFLVDAQQNTLVEKSGGLTGDEQNYYDLPEWDSADGFKLREDFVNNLNSPLAHEELQQVLHSGRGVFKNFRIVIRNYPEVEKKWHIYKNTKMLEYINGWYNGLREIWGLEKLDYVPESDESLVHDDFTFSEYNPMLDEQEFLIQVNAALKERNENLSDELMQAVCELWLEQFKNAGTRKHTGFVCRSFSNDFAGCITVSYVSDRQEKVMVLTGLFVPASFRGLGIGTELLSMCLSELKKLGKTWLILPNTLIPDFLEPLLLRTGFKKIDSGYAVNLQ